MTIKIFAEDVADYLARRAETRLHPVLAEMTAEGQRLGFPIIGPEVGRVFHQLARLRRPRRILELGSGFGYSAIWWALACDGEVEIHCTEYKRENIEKAGMYAEKAGVWHCIHYHEGDALESARKLDGPFDIILVDIDKKDYAEAYGFARERMRPGDVLVIDNMLWSGRVARPGEIDETTQTIIDVTDRAYADERMDASLLPVRDGVLVCVMK